MPRGTGQKAGGKASVQRNQAVGVNNRLCRAVCLQAVAVAVPVAAHAGVAEAQDAMTGGIGEEQFASFLRREQANAIAQHGGLGLAESIFEAMKGAEGNGN